MPHKILVVEDEQPIVDLLTYNLEREGYRVSVALDGLQALEQARQFQPDLVLLDLMLPELDGFEVCKALRKESDVPVIMLTARGAEIDRVVGLELGADDYVVKPFSVRELLARVKNVLRRAQTTAAATETEPVNVGQLRIDITKREATIGAALLELTSLEFDLLLKLAQHPGQVFSRERLVEDVWGYDYLGDLRVVDALVKRLRRKLRRAAPTAEVILTVRAVGYKLAEEI